MKKWPTSPMMKNFGLWDELASQKRNKIKINNYTKVEYNIDYVCIISYNEISQSFSST